MAKGPAFTDARRHQRHAFNGRPNSHFGGWRQRGNLQEVDKGVKEDAMRRANPPGAWGLVLRELFRGIEGQISEAPNATKNSASTNETGGRLEEGAPRQGILQEQLTVTD